MKIVTLLLIVMAAGAQATDERPEELRYKQAKDKAWYRLSSIRRTWREAMDACHSIEGVLARPITSYSRQAFNEFLDGFNFIRYIDGNKVEIKNPQVWIGLNDRKNEGSYYYASNDNDQDIGPYNKGYEGWNRGEPNNVNNEDCVIHERNNERINNQYTDKGFLDVNCESKKQFVCQWVGRSEESRDEGKRRYRP